MRSDLTTANDGAIDGGNAGAIDDGIAGAIACVKLNNVSYSTLWAKYQSTDSKNDNNDILKNDPVAWTETAVPIRNELNCNLEKSYIKIY